MQVMTEKGQKTNIGLIGLAVMGENLALNMADRVHFHPAQNHDDGACRQCRR